MPKEEEDREQSTEEQEQRKEFLDKCFEFLKHITTLSTAAALLILAIFREQPFRVSLLSVALTMLALSLLSSVLGMWLIVLAFRGVPIWHEIPERIIAQRYAQRYEIIAFSLVFFSSGFFRHRY